MFLSLALLCFTMKLSFTSLMRSADQQQLYLYLSCGPVCSGKVQLTWVLIFYLKCSQRLRHPLESHLLPAELLPELPEPWERWLDLHSSSLSGWARPFPEAQCSLPETGKTKSKSPCFHTNCYFALQKLNLKCFMYAGHYKFTSQRTHNPLWNSHSPGHEGEETKVQPRLCLPCTETLYELSWTSLRVGSGASCTPQQILVFSSSAGY